MMLIPTPTVCTHIVLTYESTCCKVWEVILTEGKIGLLSVSSLFLTRVAVCVVVGVCMRAHTHTTQMGYLVVSPGVGMRHLEGPKNPDGLNLGIHVFVFVYNVHVCIHMLGGRERSWTNCFCSLNNFFFRGKREKDVNANHR